MELHPAIEWMSGIALPVDNVFEKKLLPDGSPLIEKRKDTRITVGVPLKYRVKGQRAGWLSGAESIDVSNSGVRLAMPKSLPVGTNLELDVWMHNSPRTLRLEGTVVWVKNSPTIKTVYEYGVAFKNLNAITRKKKLIYFVADRLCNAAMKGPHKDFDCQPATTFEELKSAYQLIYKEYRQRGYCPPHPSEINYNVYCILPGTRTFLLKRKNAILGTLSLIVDSPFKLPMESVFPELIEPMRAAGRRIGEVGLLALDHETFGTKRFSLTDFHKLTGSFRLFKLLFDYARVGANLTDLIISVHPKHADLYHYLTFDIIGSPRTYAPACGNPGLPMRLNIEKILSDLPDTRSTKRYFVHQTTPNHTLNQYFKWTPESLRELLSKKYSSDNMLPPEYQDCLNRYYPDFKW